MSWESFGRAGDFDDLSIPDVRPVGFLLGLEIFFFPFLFGWALLRPCYGTFSRVLGLSWLAFSLATLVMGPTMLIAHKLASPAQITFSESSD